jgi:uncharacterized small protein (DUF1192 family)
MDDEENVVRSKDWTQRNIEPLSIEQLQEYIFELKAETERVEADIAAKKSHASAAESFFKS